MKKALAPDARCRTHRHEGLEQEGPGTGADVGGRKPELGPWWELLLMVGEVGRSVASTTAGPGNNPPGKPRMIARQADYTAFRSLEFLGDVDHEQSLPALPEHHQEVRTYLRWPAALPLPVLPQGHG